MFKIVLTGDATLADPLHPTPGQRGSILLVQDVSGNHALSLGAAWRHAGHAPARFSKTPNVADRLDFMVWDEENIQFDVIDNVNNLPFKRFWRLFMTGFQTQYSGDYVDIEAIQMRESPSGPDLCPGGKIAAFSGMWGYPDGAFAVVDGSTQTTWFAEGGGAPLWIQFDMFDEVNITELKIKPANDLKGPKDFQLQWSSDGVGFTTVLSASDQTDWTYDFKTFTVS